MRCIGNWLPDCSNTGSDTSNLFGSGQLAPNVIVLWVKDPGNWDRATQSILADGRELYDTRARALPRSCRTPPRRLIGAGQHTFPLMELVILYCTWTMAVETFKVYCRVRISNTLCGCADDSHASVAQICLPAKGINMTLSHDGQRHKDFGRSSNFIPAVSRGFISFAISERADSNGESVCLFRNGWRKR